MAENLAMWLLVFVAVWIAIIMVVLGVFVIRSLIRLDRVSQKQVDNNYRGFYWKIGPWEEGNGQDTRAD